MTTTPELTFDANGNLAQKETTPETTPDFLIEYLVRTAEIDAGKAINLMLLSTVLTDLKEFIQNPEKNNNDADEIAFATRLNECVHAGAAAQNATTDKESAKLEVVAKVMSQPCMKDVVNQPDTALKFVHKLTDKMEDYLVAAYELIEEQIQDDKITTAKGLQVLRQLGIETNTLATVRVQTERAINLLVEHFTD